MPVQTALGCQRIGAPVLQTVALEFNSALLLAQVKKQAIVMLM
jgi:hypothetical protein